VDEIKVRNPATGQLAGSVNSTSSSELAEAVARARQAQQKWSKLFFDERAAIVARFHDLVIDRSALILDTIQTETGKTRRDAFAEVVSVASASSVN